MNPVAVYMIGGAILGGGISYTLNSAVTNELNIPDTSGTQEDIIKSAIFGGLLAGTIKLMLGNAI